MGSLSVLYTWLSPDSDEARYIDSDRACPHLILVAGSHCLVSVRRSIGESSSNLWQHLRDLGQIILFNWASVVSCIKLEFQYSFYPLGGIVENTK